MRRIGMQRAFEEIGAEFVSKRRAADWGVINAALFEAGVVVKEIKGL